jgi:long-chain acyl-CoA synthetase
MNTEKTNYDFLDYNNLLNDGKELINDGKFINEYINYEIPPEEMAVMLFNSGTTGSSKAVMLSNKNICTNLMDLDRTYEIKNNDRVLSFLPLHHTFECDAGYLHMISKGVTLSYAPSLKTLIDEMADYKITCMLAVPVLFEKMYKKVWKEIRKNGLEKKVNLVLKLSKVLRTFGIDLRRKLFASVHNKFGGRIRIFVSGAAAIDGHVLKGLNDFGIFIVQGYGLTEASPVVAFEKGNMKKLGSIGQAIYGVEVKINNPNEEGIGELITKGGNVMIGYYENEEATKETIKDGWLYTGDYGYIDNDGYIYITGRKKNVIVLKNGKNIYQEEIETLINKIEGVKESFVFGKESKNREGDLIITAKIVYDKDIMKEEYNIEGQVEIEKVLKEKIKEINDSMPKYKFIHEVICTDEEFIKTTTGKVKRYEEIKKV